MIHQCGCVNEIHEPSGVLRSVSKCEYHQSRYREPSKLDGDYYAELKALDGPQNHVRELTEALGPIPTAFGNHWALEIGCGASQYPGAILESEWVYFGLDIARWSAEWTARRWKVQTAACSWEEWNPPVPYSFILCAHAIEHMNDAPEAIRKMARTLEPGGELWIVVPDDSDPVNPDHLWHFTADGLRRCVTDSGLEVIALEVRKPVPRENFIYLRAKKPA